MPDQTYSTRIHWSTEDECFVALCPELGDLSALGGTPADALAELQLAVALVLEEYCASGQAVPEPAHAPTFSGQFRLRLPKSLHARLAYEAELEGVSLNTYVVSRLAAGS